MSDFDQQLRAQLERNDRLAAERDRAEEEVEAAAERVREREQQAARELRARQDQRHAELAERLSGLVEKVRAAAPDRVDVRAGWSASGEEYLARFATVQLRPRRALSIELDRDDDEVLARWHSELGNSMELWHLLEFDVGMLDTLVLQVIDDELWRGRKRTPPFPGNEE